MTEAALVAIVTAETAAIEDADERLKQAIELVLRLLDRCLEHHQP
jgi:hypothetical protein